MAVEKTEWLVIAPDIPGALEKRMAVRVAHMAGVKEMEKSGDLLFGGPTLDEPFRGGEGEVMKINGSAFVVLALSAENIIAEMKKDVYANGEIWDMDKIQIIPVKSLYRKAL